MEKDLYLCIEPKLKDILQDDIWVTVADLTTVLYYSPGESLNLHIKSGDKFLENEGMRIALSEGKITSSMVPKEVLGIPFKGIIYPIKFWR